MRKIGDGLVSPYSVELGFSFNINLGKNLELLRNAVLNQDFDAAIIIDGKEGAGKSVLAMQIAHFLDVDRSVDIKRQICWTPDQFKYAVTHNAKGKAIVWDEARRGANRRRSTTDGNIEITDMLAECRQRNLFLVIVMPSFYDMDLNIAMHRTRVLIHVMFDWNSGDPNKPLRRGRFRFYNDTAKGDLYTDKILRTRYKYPPKPGLSFDGEFPHHYVVDEEKYRHAKRLSLRDFSKDDESVCPVCKLKMDKFLLKKGVNRCRAGHEWPANPTNIQKGGVV